MKKHITLLLVAALLLSTCALCLTGCGDDKINTYDVTFLRPGYDMSNKEEVLTIALNRYEEQYAAKVTPISSTWSDWETKVITMAAAGKAIDVIFTGPAWSVRQVNKQTLQPIDKLVNMKSKKFNKKAAEEAYTWGGNTWGVPLSTMIWCVYYNKGMIETANLEDPYQLYKDGDWTYDNFMKYIKELTIKNENDEITQYGIATWWYNGFWWGNKGQFVKIADDGKIYSGLNDQALANGLKYAYDTYNTGCFVPGDKWHEGEFLNGNAAMWIERDFADKGLCNKREANEITFDHGVVPFPYGPDNKDQKNLGEGDGYGIGKDCKNPKAAGKLLDFLVENLDTIYAENDPPVYSDNAEELFKEAKANAYYPSLAESAMTDGCWEAQGTILDATWAGNSITSAIDSVKTVMDKGVEEANKTYEKPIYKDLVEKFYDFEDGETGLFTPEENRMKTSIVEGDLALDGSKSLLIEPDSTIADELIFAKIDLSKFTPVAWRYLQIDLDYKAYGDAEGAGWYSFVMVDKDMNVLGRGDDWFEPKEKEKTHVTLVVTPPIMNMEEVYLVVRAGGNVTPVVIDNVKFSEYVEAPAEDTSTDTTAK